MIFSLVAMIGLEKCCITSACLQWLCHSGERTVAHGPLVKTCFFQNTNSYFFLNIFLDVPLSQLHKSESVEQIKEKVSTLSNTDSHSKDIPVVFVCRRGNDSQIAVNTLKEKLKDEAVTLTDITGGLTSWSKKIDPDFPTY